MPSLRRLPQLLVPRIAPILPWLAVILMALSAYEFRPMPRSIVHYRPTPAPEIYYRPAAPWLFGAGMAALLLALVLGRRTVFSGAEDAGLPLSPRPPFPAEQRKGEQDGPPSPGPLPHRWGRGAGIGAQILSSLWESGWGERLRSARRVGSVVLGAAALAALAVINGGMPGEDPPGGISPHIQCGLLVAGIALVVWGLGSGRRTAGDRLKNRAAARSEMAVVALITLAALAVRGWQLGSAVRVMVDESHFAFGLRHFWVYDDVRLIEPMQTVASFPFLFSYLQAWAVEVLGRNLGGLRAASAVIGTLTVPALYLLARYTFDRTTALLAALVLLTFPPQVHYSRLGLNNIADPLFGTLALGWMARGLHTRRRPDWALGGAMLGLTQYFYEGGRLLYPLLAAAWLGAGLVLWRPRPPLRGLAAAGLAFGLVAAPFYYTLIRQDEPLANRLNGTTLNDEYWARDREKDTFGTRVTHFKHSLMMYVNSPENTFVYYYLYYGGKHPLILEAVVPAFLLGLGIALWRWRTPGVLPLGWVLAVSVGNAALVESGVTARYVVVFPALALLIAAGIRGVVPLLWPSRWPEGGQYALMGALAGAILAGQGVFYFGPFLDLFNVEVRQHVDYDAEDALLRAADFPPGTQVFLVADKILPRTDAQRFMDFLADDLTVIIVPPLAFDDADLAALSRTVDNAIFIQPTDYALADRLRTVFGLEPRPAPPYDGPPGKQLTLYYLPALPPDQWPEEPEAVGWAGNTPYPPAPFPIRDGEREKGGQSGPIMSCPTGGEKIENREQTDRSESP